LLQRLGEHRKQVIFGDRAQRQRSGYRRPRVQQRLSQDAFHQLRKIRHADLRVLADFADNRADLVKIAEIALPLAAGEERRLAVGNKQVVARAGKLRGDELGEGGAFALMVDAAPVIYKSAHDWVPHRHDRADLQVVVSPSTGRAYAAKTTGASVPRMKAV